MHIPIGLMFIVHGLIHLIGFIVPWRWVTLEEMPYKTTILGGSIDIGALGARLVGIAWLLAAVAFIMAGLAVINHTPHRETIIWVATLFSLVLTVLGWPDSRFGLGVNVAILGYLLVSGHRMMLTGF